MYLLRRWCARGCRLAGNDAAGCRRRPAADRGDAGNAQSSLATSGGPAHQVTRAPTPRAGHSANGTTLFAAPRRMPAASSPRLRTRHRCCSSASAISTPGTSRWGNRRPPATRGRSTDHLAEPHDSAYYVLGGKALGSGVARRRAPPAHARPRRPVLGNAEIALTLDRRCRRSQPSTTATRSAASTPIATGITATITALGERHDVGHIKSFGVAARCRAGAGGRTPAPRVPTPK